MNRFIKKIQLYYYAISELKLIQMWGWSSYLIKKRFLHSFLIQRVLKFKIQLQCEHIRLIPKPFVLPNVELQHARFNFLNRHVQFTKSIKWNGPDLERLWLYNLHYFDYLLPLTLKINEKNYQLGKNILLDWICNNPVGYGVGWESYPISLRLVNWIYFFLFFKKFFDEDEQFKHLFLISLNQQSYYLTNFIEYHQLANHFFTNGKALLFTGAFFNNKMWIKRGHTILIKELDEQILDDGGHYERSSMYHAVILTDALDLLNLIQSSPPTNAIHEFKNLKSKLQQKTAKMLDYFIYITHPNKEISLLGDSALNIAPDFDGLIGYYETIINRKIELLQYKDRCISLKASGYYIFQSSKQYMIIDGGPIGVNYKPGHAHCDFLSYEYSAYGCKFFTDCGLANYSDTAARSRARSIYSHNTVVVNGMEQGQFWHVFRFGKRVTPASVTIEKERGSYLFSGSYVNTLERKKKYSHTRKIQFNEECIEICDDVACENCYSIESLIHLHPQCTYDINPGLIKISRDGKIVYVKYDDSKLTLEVHDWFYSPEFGKEIPSSMFVLTHKDPDLTSISYIISPNKI